MAELVFAGVCFSLFDAAGYLENVKGVWAFKSSANSFKGWNTVPRNDLNFLPSLHCGQFGVNDPGILGSFDSVEFLTTLNIHIFVRYVPRLAWIPEKMKMNRVVPSRKYQKIEMLLCDH